MKEKNIEAKWNVKIQLYDENMILKEEREIHNLVVALGCAYIANRVIDGSTTLMSHMAVGSGTSDPACSNTALGNELARVAFDSGYPQQGSGEHDNDVIYKATFGAGVGTGSLTEAGIFNASSNGTMLCRAKYDTITKGSSDTLIITWTLTFGSC